MRATRNAPCRRFTTARGGPGGSPQRERWNPERAQPYRYASPQEAPPHPQGEGPEEEAFSIQVKGATLEGRPLYLDLAATTPMDPRVLDRMLPFMTGQYGNPHSTTHFFGWESNAAVETARSQVADLIGANPKEGARASPTSPLAALSRHR